MDKTPSHRAGPRVEPSPAAPSAVDIAKLLVHFAASEDEPGVLTPLQVQKLLYYVQGWSLALRDRPAFPEMIEAGSTGPVVRSVEAAFGNSGKSGIALEGNAKPQGLSKAVEEFCRSVWQHYKDFSSWKLSSMTHDERPWREARAAMVDDAGTPEISRDAIRDSFVESYERTALPGLELERLRKSAADFEAGRTVLLEDLAAEPR